MDAWCTWMTGAALALIDCLKTICHVSFSYLGTALSSIIFNQRGYFNVPGMAVECTGGSKTVTNIYLSIVSIL